MTTITPTRPGAGRLDRLTMLGMGVCAVAAAVASASALAGLAGATGWVGPTRWLLPASVDVLAAVAVRVWLDHTATWNARRFARTVTLAAVAVSMGGNAAGHLIASDTIAVSWPLTVTVGALPAAALGTVVHLHALRTGDPVGSPTGKPAPTFPDGPTQQLKVTPPTSAAPTEPSPAAGTYSLSPTRDTRPTDPVSGETSRATATEPVAQANGHGPRADDLDQVRDLIADGQLPTDPSASAIRTALGVGTSRARAVRDAIRTDTTVHTE